MIPCETETSRSSSMSSRVMTPGLAWGSSPVSSATMPATSARYEIVVSCPSAASSSRATL